MIIGSRQAKFDAVSVPEITRCDSEIKLTKKWLSVKDALTEALKRKYTEEHFQKGVEDAVLQSLNFLINIGATIKPKEEVRSIRLWKKLIQLSPVYEGINMQLNTMLIKHHFPAMYKNMTEKGGVYSHWGLTTVRECALYTLEFLEKKNLLVKDVCLVKKKGFMDWIKEAEKKWKSKK